MLQYNPTVTGSLQVSGDITGTVNGINITGLSQSVSTQLITVQASTGSSDAKFETLSGVTSSALTRLTNIETKSASVDISISNINSITASNIARLSNLETKSSSVDISISNINSYTSSNDTKFTTLGTYTGSLDTKNTILADVTSSLISKTGSYATTGSNQFYGTQVFSGSVYIANDLIVQGSSSIQYISASSVSIGTNIVQLNTANPSVRFAGLTIIDSGSIGGSGSFLYDSVHDEFVFVHRGNGTNVTSSHFVLGPETYDSLGNETYLTTNTIPKGTGKEHLIDSCIFDNGTTTCIKNNLVITGTSCFGSSITAAGNICTTYVSLSNSYPNITFLQNSVGNIVTTGANDIAFRPNDAEKMRITSTGNVGIGTFAPASLLSAYNTTSTAISQMYISNPASNGTGGGNRGFDASFTSTLTSFTGTDSADQGYGYFPVAIVNGQTYTIHFKSTAVNGTLGTIITSTGTNFATDTIQTISLPTITDDALTSIRFTATGAASYIGFAGYRTSGTMSLTISEVSIVKGIPDIETGVIVAYKGIATNRINIQAPTTACIPVLGCADCTTGLIISNFDTRYGMLLGTLNTGVGWIQQARYDGTATPYSLSLNPNGGNVGIGTLSTVTTNLTGALTIVKSYNGDTPTSTTAQTYDINQSNLYLFGRNAGLTMVGNQNEESVIAFGNPYAYYIGGIRMGMGSGVAGGDMVFQTCGTCERIRISSDGSMGFNNSIIGSRSFVFKALTSRPIVIEAIENCGVHSMFFRPNNSGYNLVSSNYLSGGTYLPLSLSARENNGDLVLATNGNVGIGIGSPSQKLHINSGGFLQTTANSSWYRNVFEKNTASWSNVVGFSPQSNPQYTYGYINITASAYANGTSAGGVTTSRWYYSITNNSISVSVVGSDIATGSQAPSIRLSVSSGTINVQVQSSNGVTDAYISVFVDAMLASGYVNGTYWLIS